MAWKFNPQTNQQEWVAEEPSISNTNEIANQEAENYREGMVTEAQSETLREASENPITATNFDNPDINENTSPESLNKAKEMQNQNLSALGSELSAIEKGVATAPKATGYITELGTTSAKEKQQQELAGRSTIFSNDTVSRQEGISRPISAEETIARLEKLQSKPLTQEEINNNLARAVTNQWKIKQADALEKAKILSDRSVSTGVMTSNRARMYIATKYNNATSSDLESVGKVFGTAIGESNANITLQDWQRAKALFTKKKGDHITGESKDALASWAILESAYNDELMAGQIKYETSAKQKPPTNMVERNALIDASYSKLTRESARTLNPIAPEILINTSLAEANEKPFEAWLVSEKGYSQEKAAQEAKSNKMETNKIYNDEFLPAKPSGSFIKDPNTKSGIFQYVESESVTRAKLLNAQVKQARVAQGAGAKLDTTTEAGKKIYTEDGMGDIARFRTDTKSIGKELDNVYPVDATKIIVSSLPPNIEDSLAKEAAKIYSGYKETKEGSSLATAINSALNNYKGTGISDLDTNTKNSLSRKVLAKMVGIYEDKDAKYMATKAEANASDMKSLVDTLVKTSNEAKINPITGIAEDTTETRMGGYQQINPDTFHGFTNETSTATVLNNKVTLNNIEEKAKEILKSTLGLDPESIKGQTLAVGLERIGTNNGPVQIAIDKAYSGILSHLKTGLSLQNEIEVKKSKAIEEERDAKERKIVYDNNIELIRRRDIEKAHPDQIVKWDDTKVTPTPVYFGNDAIGKAKAEQWSRLPDTGPVSKEQMVKEETARVEKVAKQKLSLESDLVRLKDGYVNIPELESSRPDPMAIGGATMINTYKDKYVPATTEAEFDLGYDALVQRYGDNPELMSKAVEQLDKAKIKWADEQAKIFKFKDQSQYLRGGEGDRLANKQINSPEAFKKVLVEIGDMTGSKADNQERLDELESIYPNITKLAFNVSEQNKKPQVLSANPKAVSANEAVKTDGATAHDANGNKYVSKNGKWEKQ